ncbi:hypothetical protein [Pantoea sp. FN0307]|uniref:hypothetical protein n=1 Tax=Pantoea sp. FN0307 TaxID=3418560 RepID=UPI003CF2B243
MRYEKTIFSIVFLITVVIPVSILLLYKFSLTGLVFAFGMDDVSHKSDDWAAFGSLVSGIFTLSGAVGTLAALVFAINQNKKLSIEAKKRSAQDEQNAIKNDEFMKFQKERMTFEKFHLHQSMFNETLDRLERDSEKEFQFYSRSIFYKNIFPENSFCNCLTKADFKESTPGNLKDIFNLANIIAENFEKGLYYKDAGVLINDLTAIQNLLMLRLIRSVKKGDVVQYDKYVILNVVDVYSLIEFYEKTINALGYFCEVNAVVEMTSHINHAKLMLSLNDYGLNLIRAKMKDASFPLAYESITNLNRVMAIYKKFNLSEDDPLYEYLKPLKNLLISSLSLTNIKNLISEQGFKDFLIRFVSQAINAQMLADKSSIQLGSLVNPYILYVYEMQKKIC